MNDKSLVLEALLPTIERFKNGEDRQLDSGGRLICPLPWLHTNAWLHKIMNPGAEAYIEELEQWTGRPPPTEFVSFLRATNGISLFYGSINVYGLPTDSSSGLDEVLLTPFRVDLLSDEWFDVLGDHDFLVGSIGPKVDGCIWRSETGQIDRVSQDTRQVQETWQSFEEWLVLEVERFAPLFKQNGELIQPVSVIAGKAEPWPQDPIDISDPNPIDQLPPEDVDMSTPLGRFIGTWTRRDAPSRPVTAASLAEAEEDLKLKLPNDYVANVEALGLPIASMALGDSLINCELDIDLNAPQDFLTPAEIKEVTLAWREMGLPANLIAFAGDGGGNLFCFAASNNNDRPDSSEVWFFDHDFGETEVVAESFASWIDQLNSIERLSD